jgi:hypothetical protein
MIERRLHDLDDAGLADALGMLAGAIDWPVATPAGGPDLAVRVRVRLVEAPRPARPTTWWRPARRGLVLALLALLALAAVAGAIGLGLPGLRLTLAEPSASPPMAAPSATAPAGPAGSSLGLGELVPIEEAQAWGAGPLRLPTDARLGPPDAVYLDRSRGRQVAMVWAADAALPGSLEPGIGAILMAFDGTVEEAYYEKILGIGAIIERVTVGGQPGFWISGAPHFFVYVSTSGGFVDDGRRWVGDALIWSDGTTTYRLETSLDRDAAIEIAETTR